MRILLDTCVIVDALQKREPFWEDSAAIFRMIAAGKCTGCITAKSVSDIYYLTHKITHSDEKTRDILNNLFKLFTVLDTAGIDCRKALISEMTDYEDAIMVETAEREHVDIIVTRNIKDYKLAGISTMLPAEFLQVQL